MEFLPSSSAGFDSRRWEGIPYIIEGKLYTPRCKAVFTKPAKQCLRIPAVVGKLYTPSCKAVFTNPAKQCLRILRSALQCLRILAVVVGTLRIARQIAAAVIVQEARGGPGLVEEPRANGFTVRPAVDAWTWHPLVK